jgi:hypothetical protein
MSGRLLGLWFDSPLLATILATGGISIFGDSSTEELDTGAAKRGRLKRLTLLSSIKASTTADSRSSFLNFKLFNGCFY